MVEFRGKASGLPKNCVSHIDGPILARSRAKPNHAILKTSSDREPEVQGNDRWGV